jgi:hypothetical protein
MLLSCSLRGWLTAVDRTCQLSIMMGITVCFSLVERVDRVLVWLDAAALGSWWRFQQTGSLWGTAISRTDAFHDNAVC